MKIKYVGILLCAAVFFPGCGGGSSDSAADPISEKRYIAIVKNVQPGICETEVFRSQLQTTLSQQYGFTVVNLLTEETAADTTCATYGKTNDGVYCAETYEGTGNVNCVIGFDGIAPESTSDALPSDMLPVIAEDGGIAAELL